MALLEARENGLAFPSSVETAMEPRNLVRHFQATLKAINVDRCRFHNLRHTAASLLIAQGATLHEVKEILGHSQIRLTADLYGHTYHDCEARSDVHDGRGALTDTQTGGSLEESG